METQSQKNLNNVSFSVNAEKQTIDLTVIERNGETEISVQNAASDRIWVNEILKIVLEKYNSEYKIPQNIAEIVKMFLK